MNKFRPGSDQGNLLSFDRQGAGITGRAHGPWFALYLEILVGKRITFSPFSPGLPLGPTIDPVPLNSLGPGGPGMPGGPISPCF